MSKTLNDRERATVLAALRTYQTLLATGNAANCDAGAIDNFASNRSVEPLSPQEINELCQRLMAKPAYSNRVQVVALRGSALRDETTAAIITCRKTDKIRHGDDVLAPVLRAITAWVKNTAEGEEAWEGSGNDFNVGDLASYCDGDELCRYFAEEGIHELDLQIVSAEAASRDWYYDLVLVSDPLGVEPASDAPSQLIA